jgi:broad specificity phosphatase PhoE
MTTYLVVRHAETAWNREERFRGRADLHLDETGRKQAEAVARRIAAGYRPTAIFTSPLQRATQTAAVIGQHLGLKVEPHEDLIDLNYGDFEGLNSTEARSRYGGLYDTWLVAPHVVHFPNGESLNDLAQRVDRLMQQVGQDYPGETVVLVSHSAVCRVLLCRLLHIHCGHFWQFAVDPASLTVYQVDQGVGKLILMNDTSHLRPERNDHAGPTDGTD